MKVLLKRRGTGQPYNFSFINDDGKMILKSENYKAKDSASKGIYSVKRNCTEDKRYVLKESANGLYFFSVKSGNGQIVATSALYPSTQDRKDAINHLKINAPDCALEEQLG